MSYAVKNSLTFEGDEKEIVLLMETVKSEEDSDYMYSGLGTIDFRKIIPYPPCIYQGNLGPNEERETQNRNWCEWNMKHWGVKKNASNWYKMDDAREIRFDTDYDTPTAVIKELSWLFKNVQITHRWAGEELGEFCGEMVWKNGEVIDSINFDAEPHNDAVIFAEELGVGSDRGRGSRVIRRKKYETYHME